MSTTKLKPLLLPQLVEARRRKRESLPEGEQDISILFYTHSSSSSDMTAPSTPSSVARGHLRYPSSTTSVESPQQTSQIESVPTSPTFTKTGKRSLPDVQEEPQERDDFEMFDYPTDQLYDCLCDDQQCLHRDSNISHSSVQLTAPQEFDYDLAQGFFSDGDFSSSSPYKKRRAADSHLGGLATRFGTRFPSFSRKWRLKRGASAASIVPEAQRDINASRSASSRSSSISNVGRHASQSSFEQQLPPTPTKSIFDDHEEYPAAAPLDIEKANRNSQEHDDGFATTPLLPPLMMDASANIKQVAMLSPLQSPSVAEANDSFSSAVTPIDGYSTPQFPGMPSPPLSTKPSISSFHRATRPGHLVPSSEIPSYRLVEDNDQWANKLGHANFTIYPEPYVPESFDLEACRQLRANWDMARCNYTRHLVRTGEHYGVTSKTYQNTEAKWAEVDATWRQNNELTISKTVETGSDAFATLKHTTLCDGRETNIMAKIPSLNDPRSEGKFPQLGDEDIVGPMQQVAAQLQRSPSKKSKLFRFLADVFPASLSSHSHNRS